MQKKLQFSSYQYNLTTEGKSQPASESKEGSEPLAEICLNHYSNKIFIIITQINKLGTMVCYPQKKKKPPKKKNIKVKSIDSSSYLLFPPKK